MTHIDIVRFVLGIACIVIAGYWSAATIKMTNWVVKFIIKAIAFATMLAGTLQLVAALDAYV